MGAVAASGGYYVSIGADAIVANPGTITGRIGVVGGKLVAHILKDRLGVGSDAVRTNANVDGWSIDAPFTAEQHALVEAEADFFYDDFVKRVAEGRNLSIDDVDAVARGREWTGADALERGLVDELRGLRTAQAREDSCRPRRRRGRPRRRLPGFVVDGLPPAAAVVAADDRVAAGSVRCRGRAIGGRAHRSGRALVQRRARAVAGRAPVLSRMGWAACSYR